MDLLHSTWVWILLIAAPIATVIGTLARISHKQPDRELPPGVIPGTYAKRKTVDDDKAKGDEQGKSS